MWLSQKRRIADETNFSRKKQDGKSLIIRKNLIRHSMPKNIKNENIANWKFHSDNKCRHAIIRFHVINKQNDTFCHFW